MLDPTIIRRDSTPADVLAAMLPVVREAFAEPMRFVETGDAFRSECDINPMLPKQLWTTIFASHVLPAMVSLFALQQPPGSVVPRTAPTHETLMDDLADRVTAFRDAWCDAAENASKETA